MQPRTHYLQDSWDRITHENVLGLIAVEMVRSICVPEAVCGGAGVIGDGAMQSIGTVVVCIPHKRVACDDSIPNVDLTPPGHLEGCLR